MTLFEAANSLGIHGILFKNPDALFKQLETYNIYL